MLISLFAFGLFIANIWRRGWVLPAHGGRPVGASSHVLAGERRAGVRAAVPGASPPSRRWSAPYIAPQHRRHAERVRTLQVWTSNSSTSTARSTRRRRSIDNADTMRNIRLWDPTVMQDQLPRSCRASARSTRSMTSTWTATCSTARTTQVMLAARDLDGPAYRRTPGRRAHLDVHARLRRGSGARPTTKTSNGQPELLVARHPGDHERRRSGHLGQTAGIYFGEDKSDYVIVNTGRKEIDFQDRAGRPQTTSYNGKDGINDRQSACRASFARRRSRCASATSTR